MRRPLRIPAALVVALAGASAGAGCDDDEGPQCRLYCIPDEPPPSDGGVADAGPPVECPECSDEMGRCPAGCEPIG